MKTVLRAMFVSFATLFAAQGVEPTAVPMMPSQWSGKKVAFLGDSITDKRKIGTSANYWLYLSQMMGFEPWVYGINGHDWNGVLGQAKKLKEEKGDAVDAMPEIKRLKRRNVCFPIKHKVFALAHAET